MSALHGTDEIIEVAESCDSEAKSRGDTRKQHLGRAIDRHGINNDINKLFEAIEVGSSHPERYFRHKSAMKRPMRVGSCQASGIGISESVSLKQALRGLCISQASEMAAVKKRMSRPSSAISEVGAIKKLYKGVVIETNQRIDEVKGNMVEISIVPVGSPSNMMDKKISESDEMVSVSDESSRTSRGKQKERVDELRCGSLSSNYNVEESLRTHNVAKKKIVPKKPFVAKIHNQSNEGAKNDHNYQNYVNGCEELEKVSPSLSSDEILVIGSSSLETDASTHDHAPSINSKTKSVVMKADERSRSREKGEFSQSSKSSSIGEYSCTTSNSEESYLSGSSRSGYRPHMSKDLRWEAIRSVEKQHGRLGMKDFKLLRKIGGGDIGIVYLCELIGTSCFFAVKVMDNEFLASRKKMHRAQTEKEIMEILDHPFLPTLYAHFTTAKYSCLVMEYCPGGDLHVLRQKQPTRSFPEKSARFYAAEILLALEYLHMLGVVYRDLKPENILVREDGHIMLSDFDLSLRCPVNPMLLNSSSKSSPFSDSTCIHPFCLQPSSWQLSCFTPSRFLPAKTRKQKSELAAHQVIPLPQLVVEPITARSNSFVGTHEYLAPEIIKGEGHGSAVDWWTFGVLLYEILYGKTPFKGTSNEDTISNVVSQCLKFPQYPNVSSHARDLIRRLLKKEPENRMGSAMGAAEIKQHPFFDGLNWALIRCETPPISFDLVNVVISNTVSQSKKSKSPVENENGRDEMAFEMF